jgi:undecaprenyl-diphosphatase
VIELLKVVILGVVEGVTEFLPISSTGHLIVAVALLRPNISLQGTFELFIQLGAVVAVVVYYWSDLWQQAKTVGHDRAVQRLWLSLIIGAIPAGVVGLLLRNFIKTNLFNPVTVAIALIVGGVILILVERRPVGLPAIVGATYGSPLHETAPVHPVSSLTDVTLFQALLIGVAQVIALVPGVSRSAASIIGGMFVGLDRQTATRFSFYLAIPTLGGATILDLLLSLDELQGSDLIYLIVGAVVSGVVAWFAIGWLLRYVAGHTFVQFGVYRIVAGILILVLASLAIL